MAGLCQYLRTGEGALMHDLEFGWPRHMRDAPPPLLDQMTNGLAGPLAQFGRTSLVQDFVSRLTAQFARNVEAALAGSTAAPKQLDAGGMLWAVVKAWLARIFGRG